MEYLSIKVDMIRLLVIMEAMMDKYDYIFKYLRNSTKDEHHIDEMEAFARRHPILFMKFHKYSKPIVSANELSSEYKDAKSELEKMFDEHEKDFVELFTAIDTKFKDKYF